MKNGLIGVCGMVFSAVSVPVIAQSISQPSDSNPRLVTIVLKPTFTNRGLVAVYRRTPGVTGRDIIALKRSAATPELLVTVLGGLSRSREKSAMSRTARSRATSQEICAACRYPIQSANWRVPFLGNCLLQLHETSRQLGMYPRSQSRSHAEARQPHCIFESGLAFTRDRLYCRLA